MYGSVLDNVGADGRPNRHGVTREALGNICRHARASNVRVAVSETGGVVSGEIENDGVGFDVEAALARARRRYHAGLDATIEKLRQANERPPRRVSPALEPPRRGFPRDRTPTAESARTSRA
jgi:hypothetical protein